MNKNFLIILTLVFCCAGCTQAGPFVTHISFGNKEIIIEKCQIVHNAWFGTISNENCTHQTVTIN